ncbi:hypothetical protein D6D17_01343 [Aureobasidium pullulans]|nr:hypothetical protein D6D17_01343 [Aureobasidium pullulans]
MLQGKIIEPLSPPSSPRMSAQDYKPALPGWQAHPDHQPSFGQGYSHAPSQYQTPQEPMPNSHVLSAPQGPSLRSYKTSPYPLNAQYSAGSTAPGAYAQHASSEGKPHATSQANTGPGQQTLGESLPGSPSSHMSPHSQGIDPDDEIADDDDDASGEADDGENKVPMTAAEIRNQKRKMKRFRLTHNQTRFLMSEFSRQAHPDAAHRERLSREIPGLSPRQVQVWFQNRRAKLKRLTAEDRERMMKSRALPDNFDMTPSLHNNYGAAPGGITPGASPASYGTVIHQPGHIRPLTLDTLRRGDMGPSYVSPTGIPPGMTSMAYTPPHSATDTMSPVSRPPEGAAYGYTPRSNVDSPQRAMFPGPPPSYTSQYSQPPRLPVHDRFRRASGETATSSPLRSSMSYGSLSGESSQHPSEARTPGLSASEGQGYISQQDAQRNMPPPSGPYGLGLPPYGFPSYQSSVRPAQPPTSGAPSIDMINAYHRDSQQLLSQHPSSFPEYQQYHNPTPYSTPQMPHYANFGNQFAPSSSYSGPYMQRSEQQQQAQPQQPNHHQPQAQQPTAPVAPGIAQRPSYPGQRSNESEGEHSDGGVPITSSY